MATPSAPKASALATSEEILSPPVISRETYPAPFVSRNVLARCTANSVGTEVAALMNLGEAPVAPALPSIVRVYDLFKLPDNFRIKEL